MIHLLAFVVEAVILYCVIDLWFIVIGVHLMRRNMRKTAIKNGWRHD